MAIVADRNPGISESIGFNQTENHLISKSANTLVQDIYKVVKDGADVTDEQANHFGQTLSNIIRDRLAERQGGERKFTLRMSNIGKGTRQLWYDKKYGREEELSAPTLIKFMFGDIIEQLVLFLVKLSGHKVTEEQAEVNLNGIKGHIDADIDGVTVDVKSASSHSFKKFQDGSLIDNDAFGYIEQISGYAKARETDGAFLAVDKQNGHVAYLPFTAEELAVFDVTGRIEYIKKVIDQEDAPERCHPDEKMGESGNRKLGVNCSYCPHKTRCWADANGGLGLRQFLYSSGPVWLTNVAVEPKVFEVVNF